MTVHALSRSYDRIENRIVSPAIIIDPISGRELSTFGIWDTGATNSVITKKAVELLQLPIREYTDVRGVGGLIPDVPVYYVRIKLNNQNIIVTARVTECEDLSQDQTISLLIGMNIINQGDFSISNYKGKTVMTFRVPSLCRIDYVKEIEEFKRIRRIHEINVAKHLPDKCGCGSGKLYKNCHGASIYNPEKE